MTAVKTECSVHEGEPDDPPTAGKIDYTRFPAICKYPFVTNFRWNFCENLTMEKKRHFSTSFFGSFSDDKMSRVLSWVFPRAKLAVSSFPKRRIALSLDGIYLMKKAVRKTLENAPIIPNREGVPAFRAAPTALRVRKIPCKLHGCRFGIFVILPKRCFRSPSAPIFADRTPFLKKRKKFRKRG